MNDQTPQRRMTAADFDQELLALYDFYAYGKITKRAFLDRAGKFAVGAVTASAIIASIGDGHQFENGRAFAAWLGLTPANKSSGGKEKLGRITKMGDGYLRKLLVVGATAVLRRAVHAQTQPAEGIRRLLEKKPARVVSVALANKTARIVWAILSKQEVYKPT